MDLPQGQNATMVVVDRFSKYVQFISRDTKVTAATMVHFFIYNLFAAHGLSMEIISDSGPQFKSQLYEGILQRMGIDPVA